MARAALQSPGAAPLLAPRSASGVGAKRAPQLSRHCSAPSPRTHPQANPDYVASAGGLSVQASPAWKLQQWEANATFRSLATGLGYEKPMDLVWAVASGQNFTADHAHGGIDYAAFHAWLPNWKRCARVLWFQSNCLFRDRTLASARSCGALRRRSCAERWPRAGAQTSASSSAGWSVTSRRQRRCARRWCWRSSGRLQVSPTLTRCALGCHAHAHRSCCSPDLEAALSGPTWPVPPDAGP